MNRLINLLAVCAANSILYLVAASATGQEKEHNEMQGTPVECLASSSSVTSEDGLSSCEELYPPQDFPSQDVGAHSSPWRIGFGAGYGQRTNPLINSDDIDIYGIVQLSYFGDQFFFDNGDIGWFMATGSDWSANLIAGVGGERSFFSALNDSPVGFAPDGPTGLNGQPANNDPHTDGSYPEPEAPDRDYIIDGGLEVLYQWGRSELQVQLLTDISDRSNGQEVWVSWALPQQWGRFSFHPSIGVTWMSANTANYYYGVKKSEAQPGLPAYEVNDAFNYFARLSMSYQLTEHWQVVSVLQYEQLADDIADSPSVVKDHVTTSFIGLYYEF
jgi:MipA family protein